MRSAAICLSFQLRVSKIHNMASRPKERHLARTVFAGLVAGALSLFSVRAQAQTAWFRRPIPTVTEFQSVAYGGGFYSAVASRPKALQSRDGRMWLASPLPDSINQVVYFGGAGREGFYGVNGSSLFRSSNGLAYEVNTDMDASFEAYGGYSLLNSVSAFGGRLVVLATRNYDEIYRTNILLVLENIAGQWTWRGSKAEIRATNIYLTADKVVVGSTGLLMFSGANPLQDGLSRVWYRSLAEFPSESGWVEIPAPSGSWGELTAGAYGAGAFVLVGKGGKIFRIPEVPSPQAEDKSRPNVNASLSGVAFGARPGGGSWVAVGACGTIFCSSTAAHSWVTMPTRILDDLNGVTFGANSFMAVGEGGLILQSN